MPGTPFLSRSTKQERSGRDAPFWMPWLFAVEIPRKGDQFRGFLERVNFFFNFLAPLFLS